MVCHFPLLQIPVTRPLSIIDAAVDHKVHDLFSVIVNCEGQKTDQVDWWDNLWGVPYIKIFSPFFGPFCTSDNIRKVVYWQTIN